MARRVLSLSCSSLFFVLCLVATFGISGCGSSSKPISVTFTQPASTKIDPGNAITLTVTVANDSTNAGVTWSLTGNGCSGSGCGALSNETDPSQTYSATYTAPATVPTAFTVTITATSKGKGTPAGSVTLSIPANPAITTTAGALSAGQVGSAYSTTLAVGGGISPYTWSVSQGTLPAGLALAASTGIISGTPTTAGDSTFTLKIADSGSPALTATAQFSITIAPAPAITFTTTSLSAGTYKVAYSASVAAIGGAGALSYAVTTGSLPTGLTLSSAGAISGTPTATGTFPFTVTATDTYSDTGSQAYSIQVSYPQLTVTAVTLPTGYVQSAYHSTTLAATGGNGGPYTWGWAAATGSSLPPGLSISAGGVIGGTPTTAGTYSVVVTATDSASNAGSLTLPVTIKPAVSVTTASLPTGYTGSAYSAPALAATGGGGAPYTWSWAAASGSSLPAGLSLSAAGMITGTPTATGTYSVVVTATDSASNSANATLSITIAAGVSVTTASLPSGYQGTAYTTTTLNATGGLGSPYTWSWAAAAGSSLPAGLSLSTGGVLSGTPTGSGNFSVVITASDSGSHSGSATLSINIEAAIAISTASLPSGAKSAPYNATLNASGGNGTYTWSWAAATGSSLPPGLSFSTGGVISGTPTTAGSYSVVITVTDSASHTVNQTFTLTINASLAITTTTLPNGSTGAAYSQQLQSVGGTGGNTWSVTTGNLANFSLTLSAGGLLSGTPASGQTGAVSFTAQVKDSNGDTATAPLSFNVYGPLAENATGLPLTGTTNVNYSGTITASGGSGSYSWTVTGLADNLTQGGSGGTITISGTPTTATTVNLTVKLTDTVTSAFVSNNYSIVISNPTPLTLPSPNPNSLGSASVNQSYNGSINASGGVGPWTWKINGVTVTGSGLALTDNLAAINNGTNTLSVSGTPGSTGTVTLTNVTVTDSESTPVTAGPDTYTVQVNSAGSQVSGQIFLSSNCGGSSSQPSFTVTINTTPQQQTTTDGSGNYSFASVPNGSYTITPSITGAESIFYPATLTVTVNNNSLSGENFNAGVGYTVSGAVQYSGSKTGTTYINLVSSNCSGANGTSLSSLTSGGAFTIRGVAPGTYTVQAWMDTLGQGATNDSDPSGSSAVSVTTANATGANVTLTDPTLAAPTASPQLRSVTPFHDGAFISFKGGSVDDSNGNEIFTSYTVQWSTSSSFSSTAGSAAFKAIGSNSNIWIVNNGINGITGSLSDGTAYYFRARGTNSAGNGPWSVYGSPTSVTIGAPAGGNTVTGTVTIPAGITPTGPLYVGYYDQNANTAYATEIASPASSNNFSVNVPSGSNYFFFGILDQNNDGLIDGGDVQNTNGGGNKTAVVITGNLTGQDLTLPSANSTVTVSTQYQKSVNSGGTSTNYGVYLNLAGVIKIPVSATLSSGPNLLNPVDLSNYCQNCGSLQFQYGSSLGATQPNVGDSYSLAVTYTDGTTENVTGAVTAVLGSSQLATNLSPTATSSASTTPTFSWTYPANASNYVYQFQLSQNNGGTIWQIPGNNSNSNGFTSSQIPTGSIAWGVDPTDSSNTPSVGSLTTGQQYNWSIQTQDSNGNSATISVYYQP